MHNYAENNLENSETLLFVSNCENLKDKNIWFLDMGCSNHMCGSKDLFFELDESVRFEVKFGNNASIPVMGKGKISISLKDGSQNFISDVFYVPSLQKNLLSMGQLSEKGYDMRIFNGVCSIGDSRRGLIAKVNISLNRLFPLKLDCENLSCFSSVIHDDNWL